MRVVGVSKTSLRPLAKHEAYINIESVVASATLNQRIDLNSIVQIFPGVEYGPEQFPDCCIGWTDLTLETLQRRERV